jgi:hypothetical protein
MAAIAVLMAVLASLTALGLGLGQARRAELP